jgi:hypothetical protein
LIAAQEWLAILYQNGTVRFMRQDRSSALQRFDAPSFYPLAHTGTATHLCLYFPQKKRLYLMDYSARRRSFINPRSIGIDTPTLTRFSPDKTLLIAGDEGGHTRLIHAASARAIALLPKCADSISTLDFSDEGSTVAYGSFAKDLHLYCLNSQRPLDGLKLHQPASCVAFFHTRPWLLIGTRAKSLMLYDFNQKRQYPLNDRLKGWPLSVAIEAQDRYALIGDQAGGLWLLNLSGTTSAPELIATYEAAVVAIAFYQGSYTVLLESGTLHRLPLDEPLEQLQKRLEAGDGAGAISLGQAHPWLRYSAVYHRLGKLFEQEADKAAHFYLQRNPQSAQKTLAPFKKEPRFEGAIRALEIFATKIASFGEAIDAERFDQAYAMAHSNDFYRRLEAYSQLEKRFEVKFRAAVLMLTAKRPDTIGAKKALDEFSRVASKSRLLQHLFEQPKIFEAADKLLKKRQFEAFATLLKRYPILEETPFIRRYREAEKEAERYFDERIHSGDRLGALRHTQSLQGPFEPLYQHLKPMLEQLRIELAFEKSLQEQNFQSALSYAMRHGELMSHPAYTAPFFHYAQRFDKALAHAVALEFEPMQAILLPLSRIRYFKARTLLVYQCYYLEELGRIGHTLKDTEWAVAIRRFLERFGNPPLLARQLKSLKADHHLKTELAYAEPEGFWKKPVLASLLAD